METIQGLADGSTNYMHPTAYIAEAKDTLNYGKMLNSDDRDKFVTAMQNKVDGLRDILRAIPRTDLPEGHKALPAVWAFNRKRNPDWSIAKWKARLNVHGGRQRYGVNYWETYAPVVNWSTVRLVLTLSILHNFKSRQVDFIQAFTQAPLDCPIFMEVPAGYSVLNSTLQFTGKANQNSDKSWVLQLTKNMYRLKQAGHNWYNRLQEELLSIGFIQSKIYKCLFLRHDCVIMIYVDDCLLFSAHDTVLDGILIHLHKSFKITSEADIGAYLGLHMTVFCSVHTIPFWMASSLICINHLKSPQRPTSERTLELDIQRTAEGHMEITQPGLIDKVISICGLENESNKHRTPADCILQAMSSQDEP